MRAPGPYQFKRWVRKQEQHPLWPLLQEVESGIDTQQPVLSIEFHASMVPFSEMDEIPCRSFWPRQTPQPK